MHYFISFMKVVIKKNGTEERFIDDNEIIRDVLTIWKSDMEKGKQKNETLVFTFYLKFLKYYPIDYWSIINNLLSNIIWYNFW